MKKITNKKGRTFLKVFSSPSLQVIVFFVAIKLVLLFVGIVSYSEFPYATKAYTQNFHYPKKEAAYILPFKTWDAQHYLFLAEKGYQKGNESNRFFPLYPFSIAAVTFFLHNTLVSAYILSLVFSIVGGVLLYKLVFLLFKSKSIAFDAVFFLFAFPSAFFLSLVYSESLFVFLALLFFYLNEKNKPYLAMIPAILLPLTRPTGIFIIFPLFFYLIKQKKKKFTITIPTFNSPFSFSFSPVYLLILSPFAGVLIYFIIMAFSLHNPAAGISGLSAVSNWDMRNVSDPLGLIKTFFSSNLVIHGFQNSIIDRVFFIFFVVMLPFVYRLLSKPYFFFVVALGLVPLFGSFTSYTRYLLPAFPFFIVLAVLFNNEKKVIFKYLIFFLFIAFQALFFVLHILNYWVA